MKKDEIKDNGLEHIFSTANREELPARLNKRIMQGVQKTQKRREWRNFITLSLFSLFLIGITFFAVSYFAPLGLSRMFGKLFTGTANMPLPEGSLYILIAGIAMILLIVDHQLRKMIRKRKEGS